MIMIDMPMPEKCKDCIFCDANCSCIASDFDDVGINVGCAWRTDRRDLRCPLKEQPEIVRCKDCWKHSYDNCPFYDYMDDMTEDDCFCSFGERQEGRRSSK